MVATTVVTRKTGCTKGRYGVLASARQLVEIFVFSEYIPKSVSLDYLGHVGRVRSLQAGFVARGHSRRRDCAVASLALTTQWSG